MENLNEFIMEQLGIDPEKSKEMAGRNTSNNSLLYNVGKVKWAWRKLRGEKEEPIIKKYGGSDTSKREMLINWQKDDMFPLTPEEFEIIPKEEWEMKILQGVSEDALYHPHYDRWWDYIYKNFKPRHKVLTVFECSNKKPYFATSMLKRWPVKYSDWTDFASLDYGIMIWDYVHLYPVRWDEWDHFKEDERMQFLYSEKTKQRILEFHKNFPQYEKIIFICQSKHPQRPVDELWEDNTDGFRDWACIVTDDEFRKSYYNHYPQFKKSLGIGVQRMPLTKFLSKAYAEVLASCYRSKKDKDEIHRRANVRPEDLRAEGCYSIYDEDIVTQAYKDKQNPFSPKFIKEYKKKHDEEFNNGDK